MVEMVMKMMTPVMNMYRPDVASSVNPLLPPFTWQAAVKNCTYWILMRTDMNISIEQKKSTGSPQIKMAGTVLSPVTDFNVFLIIAPSTPSLFTSRDLNWVPMDVKVSLATSQ